MPSAVRIALWVDNVIDPNQSGMGYYQRGLLKGLVELGEHEYVPFFTPRGAQDRRVQSVEGLSVRSLPGRRLVWYPAWQYLGGPRVERFLPPVDVVHLAHSSVTVRTARPAVMSVVDLASHHMPGAYPLRRRVMKDQTLRRAVADGDTRFLVIAEFGKEDLCESYGVDPARVDVAPLGVDTTRFTPAHGDAALAGARRRHGLAEDFILFVGMLSPRKNVDVLIEGYRQLSARHDDVPELVLAGAPGWDYEGITRLAEATPNVRLLGYVDHADLPLLYAAAGVFAFPSSYEGFGLPVLEAMASGTAVISSDRTALPEVVGDAGVLLEALTADGVADALERVCFDEPLRRRLVAAGLERVKGFTWARHAELTLAAYRRRIGTA
jgi:alpha-1,3-rhamnosyl/mannosyltransferase